MTDDEQRPSVPKWMICTPDTKLLYATCTREGAMHHAKKLLRRGWWPHLQVRHVDAVVHVEVRP